MIYTILHMTYYITVSNTVIYYNMVKLYVQTHLLYHVFAFLDSTKSNIFIKQRISSTHNHFLEYVTSDMTSLSNQETIKRYFNF